MSNFFTRAREYFAADLAAKVRWRMRFDRNPLFTVLQDKYLVRQYAVERGVMAAKLLHVTEDPSTIPFDQLPPDYMIKATHGCGWNIICRGGELSRFGDGSGKGSGSLERAAVVQECQQWLTAKHRFHEWAYQEIHPKIIVEQLLIPRDGTDLKDYRFYTFQGAVKAVNIGSPIFRRDHLNAFFTPDWNLIPLSRYVEALPSPLPQRPESLNEMLAAAERLGQGLDFVRVDLYDTCDGVRLGEMTVYPQGGIRESPTGCPVVDGWLGDQWRMSPLVQAAVVSWNVCGFLPDTVRFLRSRMGG